MLLGIVIHHLLSRMTRIRTLPAVALLAFVAMMSCDGATDPGDNVVTARLISPHADDAAALIELSGSVDSVSAPSDIAVYSQATGTGVTRVLLIRETPGAMQLTLRLARGSSAPAAKVLEVSNGQDEPRADVTAYKVEY